MLRIQKGTTQGLRRTSHHFAHHETLRCHHATSAPREFGETDHRVREEESKVVPMRIDGPHLIFLTAEVNSSENAS